MSSNCTDIILSINKAWQLEMQPTLTESDLVSALALHINELIVNDFPRLIHMLYTIDVNEAKLKAMLREYQGTDAALLIAQLVVDRQKQKQKTRDMFKPRDGGEEGELWH